HGVTHSFLYGNARGLVRCWRLHLFVGRFLRRIGFIRRPHRFNVGNQLPDLIRGDFRSPRGHTFRAALGDGIEDLIVAASVEPYLIAKARAHPATAMSSMTAGAVIPVEQASSVLNTHCIAYIWIDLTQTHWLCSGYRAYVGPVRRCG